MSKPPVHQNVPACPKFKGPSVPSERALRGDERPRGQLGCLSCGVTWPGTPEQLSQAWRAERANDMKWQQEMTKAKNREERAKITAKLERIREGRW